MTETPNEEAGRHKHNIEEAVRVYLRLNEDGTAWEIDPLSFDGMPLMGYDSGPEGSECECERGEEHDSWYDHAKSLDLPDAYQLSDLMNAYREAHR